MTEPTHKPYSEGEHERVGNDVRDFLRRLEWFSHQKLYHERVADEWGGSKKTVARDLIKDILEELALQPEELPSFVRRLLLSFAMENDDKMRAALRPFYEVTERTDKRKAP